MHYAAVYCVQPGGKVGGSFNPPPDDMTFYAFHIIGKLIDDLIRHILSDGVPASGRIDWHDRRIDVHNVLPSGACEGSAALGAAMVTYGSCGTSPRELAAKFSSTASSVPISRQVLRRSKPSPRAASKRGTEISPSRARSTLSGPEPLAFAGAMAIRV